MQGQHSRIVHLHIVGDALGNIVSPEYYKDLFNSHTLLCVTFHLAVALFVQGKGRIVSVTAKLKNNS